MYENPIHLRIFIQNVEMNFKLDFLYFIAIESGYHHMYLFEQMISLYSHFLALPAPYLSKSEPWHFNNSIDNRIHLLLIQIQFVLQLFDFFSCTST